MTAFSVQTPYPPFADADGAPLENGYIWLGSAGLDPQSNPVTAYFDAALTIAAAQPIRTQGGYPVYQGTPARIYINGTNYSIRVMNKNGLTVYTALNTTEAWNGSVLADGSVTTAKLADGAVTTVKIAASAVTAAKVERVAANQVLRSTGVSTDPAWGALNLTTDVTGVLPAANGGTGLSAPGALNNVLSSDGAGAWTSTALSTLVPDATDSVKGVVELATTAEIQTGTDTTRAITPAGLRSGAIVSGTAQATTSGTEKDFTGIPSWVKRITVMFDGVSTSGTNNLLVQIGDSGGVETTSYASGAQLGAGIATSTAGYIATRTILATALMYGSVVLTKLDGNTWTMIGSVFESAGSVSSSAGSKTLSDVLTQVRITTVGGTDTFDAGSVNILYE
jgi:hypothetical protein